MESKNRIEKKLEKPKKKETKRKRKNAGEVPACSQLTFSLACQLSVNKGRKAGVGVALDGSFECMFGWTDLSAIDDKREVNTTVKGDRLEQRKWVKVGGCR